MKSLEVVGHWWIPGWDDKKVPGILTFDVARGGHLRLIGGLRSPQDLARPEEVLPGITQTTITQDLIQTAGDYGRLLGQSQGRPYTLEGCFQLKSRSAFFGGERYEELIHVNTAYEGIWFEEGEAAEGTAVSFTVDGLNEWVDQTGLLVSVSPTQMPGETVAELKGVKLAEQTALLPSGGKATLFHGISRPSPGRPPSVSESFL